LKISFINKKLIKNKKSDFSISYSFIDMSLISRYLYNRVFSYIFFLSNFIKDLGEGLGKDLGKGVSMVSKYL